MRDVSRSILDAPFGPIWRKDCVPSDRACTRVTLSNFHGKEGVDGSSPSEGFKKPLQVGSFLALFVAGSGDTRSHRGRTDRPMQRLVHDPLFSEEGIR
jgi:hypothetical protein